MQISFKGEQDEERKGNRGELKENEGEHERLNLLAIPTIMQI